MQNLDQNAPNRIRIRATDEGGQSAEAETTLRIYPREPVAVGRLSLTLPPVIRTLRSSGASSHPNPNRSIAQYDWDIDSDGASDGGGERFTGAYDRFGNYTVTLTVTDDLGRTHSTDFLSLSIRAIKAPWHGSHSQIISSWKGMTLFWTGAVRRMPMRTVEMKFAPILGTWMVTDSLMMRSARTQRCLGNGSKHIGLAGDRESGEPANTVTLRVEDSFGATHTVTTSVAVYTARPTAVVTQSPNPAAIGQRTGRAVVTLDGRESFSPVPGNAIEQYEWVFDPAAPPQGNVNPDSTDPAADFQKVFDLPLQEGAIPPVKAYLRVTDNTGRASAWLEYDVRYDIPPTPPTADADPTDPPEEDYHLLLGEGVILDGSQSFDPDPEDEIALYQWDLNAGDDFEEDIRQDSDEGARSEITAQGLADFGIDSPGAYPVVLQVTDNFGLTGRDDAVVNVYAVNPEATFTVNPNPAACGAQINLDASQCFHPHPDIEIVSWEWDINGNGSYDDEADARGMMTTARFSEFTFGDERKTVNLRVTDSRENTTEVSVDVEVNLGNRAPVPVAGGFRNEDGAVVGPYAISVGESVTFSNAGTADPDAACGDSIVSCSWDLNRDGRGDFVGDSQEYTWAQLQALGINGPSENEIRVTCTDRFGAMGQRLLAYSSSKGLRPSLRIQPNRLLCQCDLLPKTAPATDLLAKVLTWFDMSGISMEMASMTTLMVLLSRELLCPEMTERFE